MIFFILYILFQITIIIGVILLGYFIFDKRYKQKKDIKIPSGFIRTEEVSIDPISNEKIRVYFHPQTGERLYRAEPTEVKK